MMRVLAPLAALVFVAAAILTGCGSLVPATAPTATTPASAAVAECNALDAQHTYAGAGAVALAGGAGLSGLATAIPGASDTTRATLAISSLVVAGVAAALGFVQQADAQSFSARDCAHVLAPTTTSAPTLAPVTASKR